MHMRALLLVMAITCSVPGGLAAADAAETQGWYEVSLRGRPPLWGQLDPSGTAVLAMGDAVHGLWPDQIHASVPIGDARVLRPIDPERVRQLLQDRELASARAAWAKRGVFVPPSAVTLADIDRIGAEQLRVQAAQAQQIAEAQIVREQKAAEVQRERERAEADRQAKAATDQQAKKQVDLATLRALVTDFFTKAIAGRPVTDGSVYIGIPQKLVDTLMDPQFTGRQKESNWCWAACVQMIAKFNNVDYAQESVVKAAKGYAVNQGGNIFDFIQALTKEGRQDNGQPIQLQPKFTTQFIDLLHDLDNSHPMIACLSLPGQGTGHAVVLTGIDIPVLSDGKPDIDKITFTVRDPAPQAPSLVRVPCGAFMSCFEYAVRLRVTMW
jgi:hypothetical protein